MEVDTKQKNVSLTFKNTKWRPFLGFLANIAILEGHTIWYPCFLGVKNFPQTITSVKNLKEIDLDRQNVKYLKIVHFSVFNHIQPLQKTILHGKKVYQL